MFHEFTPSCAWAGTSLRERLRSNLVLHLFHVKCTDIKQYLLNQTARCSDIIHVLNCGNKTNISPSSGKSSRLVSWLWSTARYGPVSRSRELLGRSGQWTYGGPFLSSCRGVPGPLQRSPRPDRKQTVSQHHHGLSAFAGDFAKETAVLQDWFPFGDSSRWNSAGDQTRPQPIRNPGVHQHSRWVGQHQRSG